MGEDLTSGQVSQEPALWGNVHNLPFAPKPHSPVRAALAQQTTVYPVPRLSKLR